MYPTQDLPQQRPSGAQVTVELDWDAPEPTVEACFSPPRTAANEIDLDAFADAAVYGVQFALEVANALPCAVRITDVQADPHAAHPTLVAAAAAHAVWRAMDFRPSHEIAERVDREVSASLVLGGGELPDFGSSALAKGRHGRR